MHPTCDPHLFHLRLRGRRGKPHRPPAQRRNNRQPASLPRLSRPLSRLPAKHCYSPVPADAERGRLCWAATRKGGQPTSTPPKSKRPRSGCRLWSLRVGKQRSRQRPARTAGRRTPPLSTRPCARIPSNAPTKIRRSIWPPDVLWGLLQAKHGDTPTPPIRVVIDNLDCVEGPSGFSWPRRLGRRNFG